MEDDIKEIYEALNKLEKKVDRLIGNEQKVKELEKNLNELKAFVLKMDATSSKLFKSIGNAINKIGDFF